MAVIMHGLKELFGRDKSDGKSKSDKAKPEEPAIEVDAVLLEGLVASKEEVDDKKIRTEVAKLLNEMATGLEMKEYGDILRYEDLCKEIAKDYHFIKATAKEVQEKDGKEKEAQGKEGKDKEAEEKEAQDRKIELELNKNAMFIRKSKTKPKQGLYSINFPFVLSSHPHNGGTPICKDDTVSQMVAKSLVEKRTDHILLDSIAFYFAPVLLTISNDPLASARGFFALYLEVVKENTKRRLVRKKEEDEEVNSTVEPAVALETQAKKAFEEAYQCTLHETLNDLMNHLEEQVTSSVMLSNFFQDDPRYNHDLYTCKRVRDILAQNSTIEGYVKELTKSHESEKPKPAATPAPPPAAAPQPPKRRYIRRSAAGRT